MRWLARSCAALAAVLLIAATVGYVWMRGSLPALDGTVSVVGIESPVEITRDRNGVPHIVAESRDDALYGLGYACHGDTVDKVLGDVYTRFRCASA